MSILNGSNIDVLNLQQQLEQIRQENRVLKEALELWKPVITVELDHPHRAIISEIKMLGKVQRVSTSVDVLQLSNISTDEISNYIAKDLALALLQPFLRIALIDRITAVKETIDTLVRKKLW